MFREFSGNSRFEKFVDMWLRVAAVVEITRTFPWYDGVWVPYNSKPVHKYGLILCTGLLLYGTHCCRIQWVFCNNRQDRTITNNSVQQVGLFCTYQVVADGNVLFTDNHIASELHTNLSILLQNARAKTPDTTARHCTARPDKCRITK